MAANACLVTGGAGYIGSHVVLALRESGFRPVVLDDLSTGAGFLVPDGIAFHRGDVGDTDLIARVIRDERIDSVVHLAARTIVSDSIEQPVEYYRTNTIKSLALIEACHAAGVDKLVFSSTASVYGMSASSPLDESSPLAPTNPYGRSKLMTEQMLRDLSGAYGLRGVVLRYFNVAGADAQGRSGPIAEDATHLVTVAAQTALGLRPYVPVYGDDYDTPDGTCIRDYIHVTDIARTHIEALRYLNDGGGSETFNCGYGRGYSVLEVIRTVERIAGTTLDARPAPRRAGDVAELVANPSKLLRLTRWRPAHDDLDYIVRTALDWLAGLNRYRAGKEAPFPPR